MEYQQQGWQAILENFKAYVEKNQHLDLLFFSTKIKANKEKVFRTMLDPDSYPRWTSEFSPGSYYEGNWEEGSKIKFLTMNDQGKTSGIVSKIDENIPNKSVTIVHMGFVEDEQEVYEGKELEEWKGALEKYNFWENSGETLVQVFNHVGDTYRDYFIKTWPKALAKLKQICEE